MWTAFREGEIFERSTNFQATRPIRKLILIFKVLFHRRTQVSFSNFFSEKKFYLQVSDKSFEELEKNKLYLQKSNTHVSSSGAKNLAL